MIRDECCLAMNRLDHTTYQSPFTWRYSSDAMRYVWSEVYKRRLMRRVLVALAGLKKVRPNVRSAMVRLRATPTVCVAEN